MRKTVTTIYREQEHQHERGKVTLQDDDEENPIYREKSRLEQIRKF